MTFLKFFKIKHTAQADFVIITKPRLSDKI